jgi:hypothetical protein
VIIFSVSGVEEAVSALRDIESVLDRQGVFEAVAEEFAEDVREETPKGYSGRLKRSVLSTDGEVGYESGVETAGNPALDKKSVLRRRKWVQPEGLESVLMTSFARSSGRSVIMFEEEFAKKVDNVRS